MQTGKGNNIYHKGRYRLGEWAKHLRKWRKKKGNRVFRRTGKNLKDDNYE